MRATFRTTAVLVMIMGLGWAGQAAAGGVISNQISYQGQLKNAGSPFSGSVSMTVSLWDEPAGGNQIGNDWTQPVDVQDGLFQVDPIFGLMSVTWDGPRFLQIEVDGATLSPRQLITAAPVALYAMSSADGSPWGVSSGNLFFVTGNVGIGTSTMPERLNVTGNIALTGWLGHSLPAGTPLPFVVSDQTAMRYVSGSDSPNILGGHLQNQISAGSSGNVIAGGGQTGDIQSVTGSFNAIGSGRGNVIDADLSVIGGGLQNLISSGVTQSTIAGGFGNGVFSNYGTVGGGWSNAVFADYGTVAGGQTNIVWQNAANSFVGGGNDNWILQSGAALPQYSAIGAGTGNRVNSGRSFIGAGEDNLANGNRAFVSAGDGNEATGGNAVVVGGSGNVASELNTFVGGGSSNQASGSQAAVVGGSENIAQGQRSFAGGRRAQALHNGAFVWADSTTTTVQSTATNQFTAQASGGVRFFTNSALTTGVQVAANGGSWSSLSDRHSKQDFSDVDVRDILDRVVDMPIMTWRYQGQDQSTLHLGPVAQDFYAAFGLGGDELRIATIDADGVALAAIKGLHAELSDRDRRIEVLERELASLRDRTEDRIALLEALLLEFRQVAMEGSP